MGLMQWAGLGLLFLVLCAWIKEKVLWILGILILLWLIRLGADIWWDGRDRGQW